MTVKERLLIIALAVIAAFNFVVNIIQGFSGS